MPLTDDDDTFLKPCPDCLDGTVYDEECRRTCDCPTCNGTGEVVVTRRQINERNSL